MKNLYVSVCQAKDELEQTLTQQWEERLQQERIQVGYHRNSVQTQKWEERLQQERIQVGCHRDTVHIQQWEERLQQERIQVGYHRNTVHTAVGGETTAREDTGRLP